jgi:hypothetical protein
VSQFRNSSTILLGVKEFISTYRAAFPDARITGRGDRSFYRLSDHCYGSGPAAPTKARLLTPFQEAMQIRATFFSAERQYLGAMADARRSIRNYQRRQAQVRRETLEIQRANEAQYELCRTYVEVDCPNPTYPDSPRFLTSVATWRSSARLRSDSTRSRPILLLSTARMNYPFFTHNYSLRPMLFQKPTKAGGGAG